MMVSSSLILAVLPTSAQSRLQARNLLKPSGGRVDFGHFATLPLIMPFMVK